MNVMVIMYANYLLYWSSSLQTGIALSTYEADYITISSALREVLPLMIMTEEINELFLLHIPKPNFVCKVHEENQSCIKMFTGTNIYSIKNHIALKYHHFITHAKYVWVEIQYILTHEQLANIQTKLFSNKAFFTLRYMLCGLGYAPEKPYPISNKLQFRKIDDSSRGIVIILT